MKTPNKKTKTILTRTDQTHEKWETVEQKLSQQRHIDGQEVYRKTVLFLSCL